MEGSTLSLTFSSSLTSRVSGGLSLHKPITIARPTELPPAGCCRQLRRCSPVRCRTFPLPFPPWHDGPFQKHAIVFSAGGEPSGVREVAANTYMYSTSNDHDGLEDQTPTDIPPNHTNDTWGVRMSNRAPAPDEAIDTAAEEDVETTSDSDIDTTAARKANGGRVRLKWGIDVDLEVSRKAIVDELHQLPTSHRLYLSDRDDHFINIISSLFPLHALLLRYPSS